MPSPKKYSLQALPEQFFSCSLEHYVSLAFGLFLFLLFNSVVFSQQSLPSDGLSNFSNSVNNNNVANAGVAQSTTIPVTVTNPETSVLYNIPESDYGTFRINISSGSIRQGSWSGKITLTKGSFSETVPLGEDPCSPCFCHLEEQGNGVISFENRRPIFFWGIQTTVRSNLDSSLHLEICETNTNQTLNETIPLQRLLTGRVDLAIPNTEKNILIERIPGDDLPVSLLKRSGESWIASSVFRQGEELVLNVRPRLYNLPAGTSNASLQVTFSQSGHENILWSGEKPVVAGQSTRFALKIPDIQGPFELNLSLTLPSEAKSGFSLFGQGKESRRHVFVTRTVEGVVVPKQRNTAKGNQATESTRDLRDGLVETIDPTNPAWWKVFGKNPLFSSRQTSNSTKVRGQQLLPPSFLNGDFLKIWKAGNFQINLTPWRASSGWGQWDDFWRQSRGNGFLRTYKSGKTIHNDFAELLSSDSPETVPWESYTIPIKEPGKPHLLEIEYLSHLPQSLGISIIEPTVSGGVFPRSQDYGLTVTQNNISDQLPDRVLRYQILFWPKTKTPTILLMNRSRTHSAVFGKIRIYRAKEDLDDPMKAEGGRIFASLMTRPLFCDQFSAVRIDSPLGVHGMENWNSFYTSANRMIDYLHANGSNAMMLSVLSDGSTIYPSSTLNPTPRWDSGIFLSRGDDPVRKDVLDFVAQAFEQEHLRLIPCINLNAPLPRLEEVFRRTLRSGDASTIRGVEGIYSIGPERTVYVDRSPTSDGTGPYYNLLHPYVQEAILEVLRELVARCSFRRSICGIAVELSSNSYMQLPDDVYFGMDDLTVLRFFRESGVANRLPGNDLQQLLTRVDDGRYRARAIYIKTNCLTEWIAWRAREVHQFYRRMAAIVNEYSQGSPLYLVGTGMLDGEQSRNQTQPELSQRSTLEESLRILGFNMDDYTAGTDNIIFLRPGTLAQTAPLNEKATDSQFDQTEIIRRFGCTGQKSGASFFHRATPKNIADFDQKSPYRPTYTEISARSIPADYENRHRFARQLANTETLQFFDGGEMLPFGGEESMRGWIDVFRKIPAVPFDDFVPETVRTNNNKSESISESESINRKARRLDPVIFRKKLIGSETWFYGINNAPFHTGVKLSGSYAAGAQMTVYSSGQEIEEPKTDGTSFFWNFSLKPYDLIAFKITDPNPQFEQAEVSLPSEICDSGGLLAEALQDYTDRLLVARLGVPLDMPVSTPTGANPEGVNKKRSALDVPKFNLLKNLSGASSSSSATTVGGKDSSKPGPESTAGSFTKWNRFGDQTFETVLDTEHQRNGEPILRLTCRGTPGGIISPVLKIPMTGRLCFRLSFGIPMNAEVLPLYVTLTGNCQGKPFVRKLEIGPVLLAKRDLARQTGLTKGDSIYWLDDLILFEKLPLSDLQNLTLRFDLLAESSICLNNARLYQLAFTEQEQQNLIKRIKTAEEIAAVGQIANKLDLLDEYWTKLLTELIPDNSPLLAERPARPTSIAKKEKTDSNEEQPKEAKKSFFQKIKFW